MTINVNNLEGKEITVDYVRTASQEQKRWAATWAVFKSSVGKIILINILMLIFFMPAVAIFVVRTLYISGQGLLNPFNHALLYPASYIGTLGLAEHIYLTADLIFYSMLIVAGLIASVGVSGGAYSIKKLLNTQGKFSLKGFFIGVKVGYFKTLLPLTIFLVFLFASVAIGDWKDWVIACGGAGGGPITAFVFIVILTVLAGLFCGWLLAIGTSYKIGFSQCIKYAFKFLVATPVQTVFMAAFSLIPVWILMLGLALFGAGSPIIMIVSFVLFFILILFGISVMLLIWTSYTQWVFDAYITPDIKQVKTTEVKEVDDEESTARKLLAAGKSELIAKPILPIADGVAVAPLGSTFTRADIAGVDSARQKLGGEIAAYEQAHKNDPVYAEYNKLFADREKALPSATGKKGKKKKVSAANLLK